MTEECSVAKLRQMALPDPNDERDVWCAKELTWAADRIEVLEKFIDTFGVLTAPAHVIQAEMDRLRAENARLNGALEHALTDGGYYVQPPCTCFDRRRQTTAGCPVHGPIF